MRPIPPLSLPLLIVARTLEVVQPASIISSVEHAQPGLSRSLMPHLKTVAIKCRTRYSYEKATQPNIPTWIVQLKKNQNIPGCKFFQLPAENHCSRFFMGLWEQITQVCWCFPFYWAWVCFASSRFGHWVNNSQCRAVTIVVVKFSECILLPWRWTWRCREEWSASPL